MRMLIDQDYLLADPSMNQSIAALGSFPEHGHSCCPASWAVDTSQTCLVGTRLYIHIPPDFGDTFPGGTL